MLGVMDGEEQELPSSSVPERENHDYWAREWFLGDFHSNTHHFRESVASRGPKEVASALVTSLLISPWVAIVDGAIVQAVAGKKSFGSAVACSLRELILTPRTFLRSRPFVLTACVYFGTFGTANLTELALDENRITDDDSRQLYKFSATSISNLGLLMWRDSALARQLRGLSPSSPRALSFRTLGLFAGRDSGTMYAMFCLAPALANRLISDHGMDRNMAELGSAVAVPMLVQFITAPLHIYAFDLYNRPIASNHRRAHIIRECFSSVALVRSFRILPAFGLGSFANNRFREWFIKQENEDLLLSRKVTTLFDRRRPTPGRGVITNKISDKAAKASGAEPALREKRFKTSRHFTQLV